MRICLLVCKCHLPHPYISVGVLCYPRAISGVDNVSLVLTERPGEPEAGEQYLLCLSRRGCRRNPGFPRLIADAASQLFPPAVLYRPEFIVTQIHKHNTISTYCTSMVLRSIEMNLMFSSFHESLDINSARGRALAGRVSGSSYPEDASTIAATRCLPLLVKDCTWGRI